MSQVSHAQAVEAAKRTADNWHSVDHGGPFEECTARDCVMAKYILSAPGPLRDAEWCREFVEKCVDAGRNFNDLELDRLTVELTTAIGATTEPAK